VSLVAVLGRGVVAGSRGAGGTNPVDEFATNPRPSSSSSRSSRGPKVSNRMSLVMYQK
jgi:hypothetical protein